MKISVGQALLILLDKYRDNPERYSELKQLYLSGSKNQQSQVAIDEYLTDPALASFEISKEPEVINHDSSRRYFETHLAYETLASQLDTFSPEELSTHAQVVKKLAPPYYAELYEDVLNGNYSDATEQEYADYLRKLREKEIFPEFSDTQREKISAIVTAAFVAMIIASQGPHLLPLDIYGEGIYLHRGKESKKFQESSTTSAYGLLQSKDPVSLDDPARMLKTQKFLKPSEQATYNLDAEWVQDNFSRLVHPFSNSLSGTMLCQIRALLKINGMQAEMENQLLAINTREKELVDTTGNEPEQEELAVKKKEIEDAMAILQNEVVLSSKENLRSFLALYVSALLFNAGGHSLHEFTAPIGLEAVKEAFADIEGFDTLDLEELFLNHNQEAFDRALDKAIGYNNQMIKRAAVKEELESLKEEFDQNAIPQLINKSTLPHEVRQQLLGLAEHDKDLAKDCLNLAEKLQVMVTKNETRVNGEYLSFFRQGAKRHALLTTNLNKAIGELSQGNWDEAKSIIKETIETIEKFQSTSKPELNALKSLYAGINSQVDAETQMSVGKI